MRIVPNSKNTNIVWSEGSEIGRSMLLTGVKCVENRTCYKAKYLIHQLLEMRICVLEAEVKLILARLQMNKNVGAKTGLTTWKCHT